MCVCVYKQAILDVRERGSDSFFPVNGERGDVGGGGLRKASHRLRSVVEGRGGFCCGGREGKGEDVPLGAGRSGRDR